MNRLRAPADADIMMPGGTVSIVGTTSTKVTALDDIRATADEANLIVAEAARMLPALARTRYIRAYAGVRPLVGAPGGADGRSLSRGYALFDHEDQGLDNLASITGGKLTTCRLMAERAADLVCRRLGVNRLCLTATTPLPIAAEGEWTEPGYAPRVWARAHGLRDTVLCECELVSAGAVDALCAGLQSEGDAPTLRELGLRSRLGKGACQGAYCALRTMVHLHDRDGLRAQRGMDEVVDFLRERWRGEKPVLWGEQLAQAELTEALHCGLFGMELRADAARGAGSAAAPDEAP